VTWTALSLFVLVEFTVLRWLGLLDHMKNVLILAVAGLAAAWWFLPTCSAPCDFPVWGREDVSPRPVGACFGGAGGTAEIDRESFQQLGGVF
jgi:hypothetical protein